LAVSLAIAATACTRGPTERSDRRKSAADRPAARSVADPDAMTRSMPFTDRAAAWGVVSVYRNGEERGHCSILESLGGGVGWIDFDRDGRLDLVAPRGGGFDDAGGVFGLPTALFRRNAGGAMHFRDVAGPAGIGSGGLYTHGVAVGDIDNDGFPDLVVTGYGPARLWHNLGDGSFEEVRDWPGAADPRWSASAGFADVDGDGCLDCYLTRYVDWSFDRHPYCGPTTTTRDICPPREFDGLPDSLYRNRGDGGFEEVSAESGLRTDGKGLGVLLADVDDDGDVDIYVANDTVDNFLYVNAGDGRFDERGLAAGVAIDDAGLPNGSMGVDLCDFNRDGRPDIWVANYEREAFALYRGEGRGQFLHVSRRHGITALGGLFVGFGTVCRDLDSDGRTDIAVANGHVIKYPDASPRRQVPLVLALEGERFRRVPAAAETYFSTPQEGRGLAAGDCDGDGDLDLAVSHLNASVAILENGRPSSARRLRLELVGTRSNRDAIGARVEIRIGEVIAWRGQVTGGGSYLSHSEQALHATWPADAIPPGESEPPPTILVRWPSGLLQRIEADRGTRDLRIVEASAPAAARAPTGAVRDG
jgi:hypothetical protein